MKLGIVEKVNTVAPAWLDRAETEFEAETAKSVSRPTVGPLAESTEIEQDIDKLARDGDALEQVSREAVVGAK